MKAAFLLDQYADADSANDYQRGLITFRTENGIPVPIFAAGTEVSGDWAVLLCRTGQATPLDDECKAAVNLSDEQLSRQQVIYKMATLGIHNKDDQELYKAGVILGYNEDLSYKHGPNWDEYQRALNETEEDDL